MCRGGRASPFSASTVCLSSWHILGRSQSVALALNCKQDVQGQFVMYLHILLFLSIYQRNLTEYFVAVDVNNMLQLYASMLHERRIIITSSKLSTVSLCSLILFILESAFSSALSDKRGKQVKKQLKYLSYLRNYSFHNIVVISFLNISFNFR